MFKIFEPRISISLQVSIYHYFSPNHSQIAKVQKTGKLGKPSPFIKVVIDNFCLIIAPPSSTGVPSKLLEHIVSSNIISHLNSINFFYPHQHGFRKGLSCGTQLAEFNHDLLVNMNNNYQTDIIFLDFAKAFDRVPHRHLLTKLLILGINSTIIA